MHTDCCCLEKRFVALDTPVITGPGRRHILRIGIGGGRTDAGPILPAE